MATLTQPAANGFVQISPIDDTSNSLTNISHHVTVSKLKTQQAQSFTNHVSNISKQTSFPIVSNATSFKENGLKSPPKPQTTSQNRPPKIKLLNRSPAFNSAPNLSECNGEKETLDDANQTETETMFEADLHPQDNTSTDSAVSELDNFDNLNEEKAIQQQQPAQQQTTPSKFNHASSSSPKQPSFEYSSSPSSTTSSLNRDNSLDYKDSTGVDLHEFMVKTLRENPRDRLMLLKLERDFTEFINDGQKIYYKYPQMTSYHRMLIHRVAAYFGLDHNVDSTGKSVIISKTPASRVPDTRFQSYCSREYTDEEISAVPKSILPRSSSSEEGYAPPRYSIPMTIDRRFCLEDKRSKSIEEREDDYKKAKQRIFNKDSMEMLSTSSSPVEGGADATLRSIDNQSSESGLSEKEAAIAAVAAATGRKVNSKRFVDRKHLGGLQFTPVHQYAEGYQQAATIAINPQTGQPHVGPDGNPLYYQPNYSANPVSYLQHTNNTFIQQPQQPQQQQQQPQQQQQQSHYMPLYYVNNSNPSTPETPQQGSSYYMVQQGPQGQVMYIPTQTYQDYNQFAALSLNERPASISDDSSLQEKQVTTPTSPIETPEFPSQPRQVVYMQNGRVVQMPAAMYQQPQPGYGLQYYQSLPGGYTGYSVNQYGQVESPQYNVGSQPASPSPHIRSPNPTVVQQHFINTPGSQNPRPLAQTHQIPGQTVHRPRFVSGIMSNPRVGSPVYVPVASGTPHAAMVVAGQYNNTAGYSMQAVYRADKIQQGGITENADHNVQTHRMQTIIPVNQQKPVAPIQQTYQPPYSYISQQQRFVSNPVHYNTPFIRSAGAHQQHRRYRPARHPTNNQQIRISRPNSNTSETDQKTVSHILEIFDFPDTVTSDADAIFDEIKSSGARILKINSSSSQSLNNSLNAGVPNQRPTILAIFKSAIEAQKALESVTSPYYKLRVSQKSPTHFANGTDYTGATSPSKNN